MSKEEINSMVKAQSCWKLYVLTQWSPTKSYKFNVNLQKITITNSNGTPTTTKS